MAKHPHDVRQTLAAKLFSAMLDDIIMDTALDAHREVRKRQNMDYTLNLTRTSLEQDISFTSVPPAPSASTKEAAEESVHTNGAPKQDGNILLDCVNCKRPIASSRYANHLASCMGLSVGARRGGPRNASKRFDSEGARSASPQVSVDERNSVQSQNARNSLKRPHSPSDPSVRDVKRAKTNSGKSTPVPRNGSHTGLNGAYNSIPREPSKLRSSPVASQDMGPSPSQSDRHASDSDATPSGQQSSFSAGSNSQQLSGDIPLDVEEKDPDYVDIDGQVDTESSESDSEG